MSLSVDLLGLLLYCAQQLGIMLGVGAETILLIAYLVFLRDGQINETEENFARTISRVLVVALALIVTSGLVVTILHMILSQTGIVFEPAFFFKWLLIVGVVVAALVHRGKSLMHFVVEGIIGGTWYALFLVHITAPVATWGVLFGVYACWMIVFLLCWSATVFIVRRTPKTQIPLEKPVLSPVSRVAVQPTWTPPIPKPIPPPVVVPVIQQAPPPPAPPPMSAPKPVMPPPVVPRPLQPVMAAVAKPLTSIAPTPGKVLTPVLINLPPPHALEVPIKPHITPGPPPHKPMDAPAMTDIDEYLGLPALKIMPKTVEDMHKQNQGSTIQFAQS